MFSIAHLKLPTKKLTITIPLSASLLAISATASMSLAQEVEEEIEEIIVTATRISGQLGEIGSSVEVITADDLAKNQEQSVADAIRQMAGVSLSRTGGLGGVTNVRIRGSEAGQAVVLLNGVKLNDLSSPSGGYNYANLFTGNISQIEVLKGPQSTLYGSDAMGGVVAINTKPKLADDKVSYGGFLEYGAYDTKRFGGSVGYSTSSIFLLADVSYVKSDSFSAADENAGNTELDPYENLTYSANMGVTLFEDAQTEFGFEGFARVSDANISFDKFDWALGYVDGNETEDIKDKQFGIKTIANLFSGRFNNTLTASWSDINRHDFSQLFRRLPE